MRILFPLPASDFDPTESAIPWRALTDAGHEVFFATPDGRPSAADQRVLTGRGFAIWQPFLRARPHARAVYAQMAASRAFQQPLSYAQLAETSPDGMLLTGGHAPAMKPYLESDRVQALTARLLLAGNPVAAICHGVLVAARARDPGSGRSILHGRKTTALTRAQELSAWAMTGLWLPNYYRTYPQTIQGEVTAALQSPADFLPGPFYIFREGPDRRDFGFTVRSGNYLSARYFGDTYRFADEFLAMVAGR